MAAKNPKFLPEQMLIEIFSRLPAKSVGKCRCLSKFWSTHLSTPDFITKHLLTRQKALHKQEHLFLVRKSNPRSFLTITSPMKPGQESTTELAELTGGRWSYVFGSCNGLVLLTNQHMNLMVLNPVTRQQFNIPDLVEPESKRDCSCLNQVFGFGYDSVGSDYKIVSLAHYVDDRRRADTLVDVYSLKSGVWRNLGSAGYGSMFPVQKLGVLVNGALHWSTGGRGGSAVAAFDLSTERFRVVEFPKEFDKHVLYNEILVLGECLCMVDVKGRGVGELWVMREYGKVESWCKFPVCGSGLWDGIKLLCCVGEGKVLGVSDNKQKWSVCDLEKGVSEEVCVGGGKEAKFCDGCTFVDSLVSFEGQPDGSDEEVAASTVERTEAGSRVLLAVAGLALGFVE